MIEFEPSLRDFFGRFENRREAGRILARQLIHLTDQSPLVLGLPRGGVAVAAEVATALAAPLDILLVRKLGAPFQRELAIGAIGEEGVQVIDDDMVRRLGISKKRIHAIEDRERKLLEAASEQFAPFRPRGLSWDRRTLVITDDGIATGSTVRAACMVARQRQAQRIVVAVPVATHEAVARISEIADEVVVTSTPVGFMSISQFYEDFSQVTDEEVSSYLRSANPVDGSHEVHEPLEGDEPLT